MNLQEVLKMYSKDTTFIDILKKAVDFYSTEQEQEKKKKKTHY